MVLKKSVADLNTGNTVRVRLLRDVRRTVPKASKITNGKTAEYQYGYYMEEVQRHKELLNQMIDNLEGDVTDWYQKLEIKNLVSYFVELDEELILHQSKYIPQSSDSVAQNKVLEILENIKRLQSNQDDVDNRVLALGHSSENALRITVTHTKESQFNEKIQQYSFRTYPYRAMYDKQVEAERKLFWQKTWYNTHYRGVQRKTEMRRVRGKHTQVGWQDTTNDDNPFTRFEDINISITEPTVPDFIPNIIDPFGVGEKLAKKVKGQKVKRQSYWNNLDPKEVKDLIASRQEGRERYLLRKEQNRKQWNKRREWRQKKRGLPPSQPVQEIHVPVGLPPDEAARYRESQKNKARIEKEKAEQETARLKHAKNEYNALKKKETETDTFLTSLPNVSKSKRLKKRRTSIREGNTNIEKDEEVPKETKEKLRIWEFVEDLYDDSRKKSKVILKTCGSPKNKATEQKCVKEDQNTNNKLDLSKTMSNNNQSSQPVPSHNATGREKRKNGRKRKREKARLALDKSGAKSTASDTKEEQPIKEKTVLSETVEETQILSKANSPEPVIDRRSGSLDKLNLFSDVSLAPINIVVKASSLRPSVLLKSYGEQYHEGNVFPRMFTVDITERVKNTVKMFRNVDAPFVEPLCALLVEASYHRVDDVHSNSNFALTNIKLHIKADMPQECLTQLYQRMNQKVNLRLIYPLSKIVEYCVQMYNSLPHQSFSGAVLVSPPSPIADERTRSQLDWLSALCQWSSKAHTASDAYLIFSNGSQALTLPRPTTSSVCRVLEDARYQLPEKCDKRLCERSPTIRLLSCQHAICRKCLNKDLVAAIARKQLPLTCQILNCGTELDEAALALGLSLPQRKLQCVQQLDDRIAAHPLWQWCPKEGCGRVVKLGGAGLLNNNVTVVCDCGHVWCFQCREEGHWPASCDEAKKYRKLMQQDPSFKPTAPFLCEVIEVTPYTQTSSKSGGSNDKEKDSMNDSGVDMIADECTGRYELTIDLSASPIDLPSNVVQAKELSADSLRTVALPLLYYRCALEHRAERLLWCWSTAEIRASTILHKIKRSSRLRLASSYSPDSPDTSLQQRPKPPPPATPQGPFTSQSLVPFQPSPPLRLTSSLRSSDKPNLSLPKGLSFFSRPATSQPLIAGKQDAEKFFLVTVQRFVHQCHTLLEFVYVYMMDSSIERKRQELRKQIFTLEAVIMKIDKLVTSPQRTQGGGSILEELHSLHERGTKAMKALTELLQPRSHSPSPILRTPTIFKPAFAKLPPIGYTALPSDSSKA